MLSVPVGRLLDVLGVALIVSVSEYPPARSNRLTTVGQVGVLEPVQPA